jgi:hypothetical protein
MPKLKSIGATNSLLYTFSGTSLTSFTLPELETISGPNSVRQTFKDCSSLTMVDFPKLNNISGSGCLSYCFNSCTNIQNIYFRALKTTSLGSNTNQFDNLMTRTGSTTTHTIHFPSNLQSTISTLSGYPLFGGASGKVVLAFDLPATS